MPCAANVIVMIFERIIHFSDGFYQVYWPHHYSKCWHLVVSQLPISLVFFPCRKIQVKICVVWVLLDLFMTSYVFLDPRTSYKLRQGACWFSRCPGLAFSWFPQDCSNSWSTSVIFFRPLIFCICDRPSQDSWTVDFGILLCRSCIWHLPSCLR